MSEPTGPKVCAALGGCIGYPWCDYCGRPHQVGTTARQRLAALIARLRADLDRQAAA